MLDRSYVKGGEQNLGSLNEIKDSLMQMGDKITDDMARLFSNMLGVAQGTKMEAEAAFKSWFERMLAAQELVTRSEFEALKAMAVKAREENEALSARISALEAALKKTKARKKTS